MLEISRCLDESPFAFRHLLAIDRQESMNVDFAGQVESCRFQHAGPEQSVEVRNVFTDKMMNLGL